MAPNKGLGAYFLYTEENRAAEKERLVSDMGEGAKVSVAVVAKALGQKWKSMSEEEKQKYKDLALVRAAEKEEQAKADGQEEGGEKEEEQEAKKKTACPTDGLFAISIVKRIVACDDEFSRISAEGLALVAAAADQFLGLLAQNAAKAAKAHKRKTIKLDDFVQAVKQDRRLYSIGLKDVTAAVHATLEEQRSAADAAGLQDQGPADGDAENVEPENEGDGEQVDKDGGKEAAVASSKKKGPGGKKQKVHAAAARTNKIDSFFKPAAAV